MRELVNDKQGLIDLIEKIDKNDIIMIEVGSYAGESAEIFVKTGKVKTVICIDPWHTDPRGDNLNSYIGMEEVEKRFDEAMNRSTGKILKFKGTLGTFLESDLYRQYEGKIDLVYIDGLHTYDGCISDIRNTVERVKPKIAVAGHDYADDPPHIRGVKKAVNEVFTVPDTTFCDTSWIKFLNI